ncbi:MAG: PLP-dependent aminotransferase family protein [Candidatus Competibacteraceae bacterium]|nr:PLP-dependent aminotransferase family protein [Candidatus Competibacteraceae bacterium]
MFSERIDRLTSSLIREILALTQKPEVISFAGGLPARDAMPDLNLTDVPAELRQYGATEGEIELRAGIAQHLQERGLCCKPEHVVITSGSQQGIDLVAKLFIDKGTPVALEAPSYLAAIQAFRLFGAHFEELPLNSDGVDPGLLRQLIQTNKPAFIYLIPTFQNPSGVCYSETIRAEVAEVLEQTGTPLVEDEPYRELAYETVDRDPLCARMRNNTWIMLGTFSKTGLPGLRIGYIAASENVYPYLVRIKQCTDLHTNRIGQWWSARFLNSPDYRQHMEQLCNYYRERRDAMQASLEKYFHDIAYWETPHGGLFFWIRLTRDCDTRALLVKSLERNVAFMPGEPFFAKPNCGCFMRLNFSHATPEQMERGLAILAEVIREQFAQLPLEAPVGVEI